MTRFWRYYTTLTSSFLAGILTFGFLWFCTSCMIFTILFWMVIVACAVAMAVWAFTDPQRKPWDPSKVPFVDLDKAAYRKGGKR